MSTEEVKDNSICECVCHSGEDVAHSFPCCYECPKCKKNIVEYAYNAHLNNCSRKDVLKARRAKAQKVKEQKMEEIHPPPKTRKERSKERRERLVDTPTLPNSTKSRYRKR